MAYGHELQRSGPGRVVLMLHGDLGATTLAGFHRAFAAALTEHPSWLTIDLAEVTSFDPAGMRALLAAGRMTQQVGCGSR